MTNSFNVTIILMIKAVIFDMNGVIIVDEEYHNQSWQIFCKKYGFNLTDEEFKTEVMGKRDEDTLNFLFKRKLSQEEINNYSDERDEIVKKIVENKLNLNDGLIDVLEEIKSRNIPLAIATSSRVGYLNIIIDRFNLRKYFRVIVTADDVINGKPDPEIYLKTADKLNVNPGNCLVFEDSRSGIKSAKSAGMRIIGITTSLSKQELESIADFVISTFKEFSTRLLY